MLALDLVALLKEKLLGDQIPGAVVGVGMAIEPVSGRAPLLGSHQGGEVVIVGMDRTQFEDGLLLDDFPDPGGFFLGDTGHLDDDHVLALGLDQHVLGAVRIEASLEGLDGLLDGGGGHFDCFSTVLIDLGLDLEGEGSSSGQVDPGLE